MYHFFNNYCQNIIDNLNISAIMYLVDLCTLEGIRGNEKKTKGFSGIHDGYSIWTEYDCADYYVHAVRCLDW